MAVEALGLELLGATGSIITELAKGKTLDEAKKITWKQAADELGGLPPIKAHCAVLAVDGLRSAIRDYEERHGLVKGKKPTAVAVVRRRLRHVMDPLTGLDLVRTEVDIPPRPDFDYQEALIVAMKREKASFRLYTDLATTTGDENLRTTFLALAQEEAKHKLRLEVEYDEHILTEH